VAKGRKPKKYNKKTFVVASLRRASIRWPPRNEALKRGRVSRGLYKCSSCTEVFKKKEVHLDHIVPVISPEHGFIGYDDFIERLFCDTEGFQLLCKKCHEVKTLVEDELRKVYKTSIDKA
jgi:5-methylcytosine-specific restriction endonuclease McrA